MFLPLPLARPSESVLSKVEIVNRHHDVVRQRQHPDPDQLVGWWDPLLVLVEQKTLTFPTRLVARDRKTPQQLKLFALQLLTQNALHSEAKRGILGYHDKTNSIAAEHVRQLLPVVQQFFAALARP